MAGVSGGGVYSDMQQATGRLQGDPNHQRDPVEKGLPWATIGFAVAAVVVIVIANIVGNPGERADQREEARQEAVRAQDAAAELVADATQAGLEVRRRHSRFDARDRSTQAAVVIDTDTYPLHITWIEPVEASPVTSGQEQPALDERPDGQPRATIPCGPTGYVVDPHLDWGIDGEETQRLREVDFDADEILATATRLAAELDCPSAMPRLGDR
jgi:hypothetical protein